MKVLLTGSTGFIGRYIVSNFGKNKNIELRISTRKENFNVLGIEEVTIGDINSNTDWSKALKGIDSIIHLAGLAHESTMLNKLSLSDYKEINISGTLNLASQASKLGIKRFIFLSSIKVNGEKTFPKKPFTADDLPMPSTPYGISKYEAEKHLMEIANKSDIEVVIIRPVLVYGPGVKANFLSLMKWISKGLPLPFKNAENIRSLVSIQNLVDLIITCLIHPSAANQVFLVSDGETITLSSLVESISRDFGKKPFFLPFSSNFLKKVLSFFGFTDLSEKLYGFLEVDILKTRKVLGWEPKFSFDEALKETTKEFKN